MPHRPLSLTSILGTFLALSLALPAKVGAQTQAWEGVCVEDGVATIQGVQCLLANVFSVAFTAIGFVGFVMILIAAFRYMISGGNSKDMESVKNTLTYLVVGIAVALSAFIIIRLIAQFTGVSVIEQFSIRR
ncbi:MAG: hypothetical protein M3Q81_02160 [bacterium]|nr:hypothetical protein [bacterium]